MSMTVQHFRDPLDHIRITGINGTYMTMPCAWTMDERRAAFALLCGPLAPKDQGPDWREVNVLKAREAEREKERDEARQENEAHRKRLSTIATTAGEKGGILWDDVPGLVARKVGELATARAELDDERRDVAGHRARLSLIREAMGWGAGSSWEAVAKEAIDRLGHEVKLREVLAKTRTELDATRAQRDEAASEIGRLKLELHDMRNRCQAAEGALALATTDNPARTLTVNDVRERVLGITAEAPTVEPGSRKATTEAIRTKLSRALGKATLTVAEEAWIEAIADGLEARERAAIAAEIAGGHG